MEIKTVITEKAEIEYIEFGKGTKPFVIIPGMSLKSVLMSADAIEKQYAPIAENFRVFLFERKNGITENYTVPEMAEDTAAAMKALGICACCLLGASQGGMISVEIAKNHPELVDKLILAGARIAPVKESDEVFIRWKKLSHPGNIQELVSGFCDDVYSESFCKKFKSGIIEAHRDVTEYELKRFSILADACLDYNGTEGIENISCPTLVIGADGDRVMTNEAAPFIASHIPGCVLIKYESGSHAVYDEDPDVINEIFSFAMG